MMPLCAPPLSLERGAKICEVRDEVSRRRAPKGFLIPDNACEERKGFSLPAGGDHGQGQVAPHRTRGFVIPTDDTTVPSQEQPGRGFVVHNEGQWPGAVSATIESGSAAVLARPAHSQAYLAKPGQMDMSNPEWEGGFALLTEDVTASTGSKDDHEASD